MMDTSLDLQAIMMIGVSLACGAALGWGILRIITQPQLLARLMQAETLARQNADWLLAEQNAHNATQLALEESRAHLIAAHKDIEHMKGQRAAEQANFDQRLKDITQMRATLDKDMKSVSDAALKDNQKHFMMLAQQFFEKERTQNKTELTQAREALGLQLKPVQDTLKTYQDRLALFEKNSQEGLSRVSQEIRQVATLHERVERETSKLTNALRAAPKTRGRWGEHQLKNVLELAGMAEHVDFTTEESFKTDTNTQQRPDAIIHIPGNRHMIVDAKVSISAYLDALDATDEPTREELLRKHAAEFRQQAIKLGQKAYWDALPKDYGNTPDMVVMFVPGDNFYAAAIERDNDLFADALDKRVLIVTPTTLFAVAKAIAYGWQQAAIGQEAEDIAATGKAIYDRLFTTMDHAQRLRKAIDDTVKHYNKFAGSLERSTLPPARKLSQFKGLSGTKPLPDMAAIDSQTNPFTSPEAARLATMVINEPTISESKPEPEAEAEAEAEAQQNDHEGTPAP